MALWGFLGSVTSTGEIYSDTQLPGIYGEVSDGELFLQPDKYGAFQLGYPMGVPFMDITELNLKLCSAEHNGFSAARPHLQLRGGPGAIKMWRDLSVTTNLGYDNLLLFLFLTITIYTNYFFAIFEKQMSQ
jgi:hypothetical protein